MGKKRRFKMKNKPNDENQLELKEDNKKRRGRIKKMKKLFWLILNYSNPKILKE